MYFHFLHKIKVKDKIRQQDFESLILPSICSISSCIDLRTLDCILFKRNYRYKFVVFAEDKIRPLLLQ